MRVGGAAGIVDHDAAGFTDAVNRRTDLTQLANSRLPALRTIALVGQGCHSVAVLKAQVQPLCPVNLVLTRGATGADGQVGAYCWNRLGPHCRMNPGWWMVSAGASRTCACQ